MNVRRAWAEQAAVLLAAASLAGLLSIRIGAPWTYIHDDNGACAQAMGSAHLRAGLAATGGGGAFVRRDGLGLERYLHHPPLYPLVLAGVYRAAGRSDPLVTRLVSAAFHLVVGWAAFVVLAGVLYPSSRARRVLAVWIYALVPMSAYFGKMPNNEPLGLAWVVAAVAATCLYRNRPGLSRLVAATAFWLLAGLTSWVAHAVALGFAALFAIEAGRERRPGSARGAWALALVSAGSAALVLAQVALLERPGPTLFAAGSHWSIFGAGPAAAAAALGASFDFHRIYFANVPFLLYLVWIFVRVRGLSTRAAPEPVRVILAGTLGLGLYAIAYAPALAIHAYGQFWFLPFESLAAADLAMVAWGRLRARPALRAALAAIALTGTVASSAVTLRYRHSRPHGYAVRTAREFEARYFTHP